MLNNDKHAKRVIAAVKKRIGNEPWFRGVCLDSLDQAGSFDEAVEQAILDTMYWDAPNHGLGTSPNGGGAK